MNSGKDKPTGERFTGHGPEWRDSDLSPQDAQVATAWVEQRIDKRSMLTNKDRVEDVRDAMWELEKDGEIVVHRIEEQHKPKTAKTIYVHSHMDEHNFDTERVKQCCVGVPAPDGGNTPTCSYNVLYRERDAHFARKEMAPLNGFKGKFWS